MVSFIVVFNSFFLMVSWTSNIEERISTTWWKVRVCCHFFFSSSSDLQVIRVLWLSEHIFPLSILTNLKRISTNKLSKASTSGFSWYSNKLTMSCRSSILSVLLPEVVCLFVATMNEIRWYPDHTVLSLLKERFDAALNRKFLTCRKWFLFVVLIHFLK